MDLRPGRAGAVDQRPAAVFPGSGLHGIQSVLPAGNGKDLFVKAEGNAVEGSVVRQGKGHLIGTYQGAGGH